MDAQLAKNITRISNLIVLATAILVSLHTTRFSIGLGLFLCAFVAFFLLRAPLMRNERFRLTGTAYLYFLLGLALYISVGSESFFAQIYIFILIVEFTLHHSRNQSILFTVLSYACSYLSILIYRHFPPFDQIFYLLPRMVDYFALFGMSHLAKIAFQQRNQLIRDNEQLRIASLALEQKAVLQERTRISREIHDSVGHTLTSALTGLMTAAHAIEHHHYPLAKEMIDRTKENIQSGLHDVRSSVHLLRENAPGYQFIPELKRLIDETKKRTHVEMACEMDSSIPDLSPLIELTIYRALQEGITNGIRHGGSTFFHFTLTREGAYIRFILSDNGTAPPQIDYGFGLNAMKERVEEVGGTLSISTQGPTRGVCLNIIIPIQTLPIERSERIV